MNRRNFLKTIAITITSVCCGITFPKFIVKPDKYIMSYAEIGRKILIIDTLPQGAMIRYKRDIAAIKWVKEKYENSQNHS